MPFGIAKVHCCSHLINVMADKSCRVRVSYTIHIHPSIHPSILVCMYVCMYVFVIYFASVVLLIINCGIQCMLVMILSVTCMHVGSHATICDMP